MRLSVDKTLDDDDLPLPLYLTGENLVGPDPPVRAVNDLSFAVRLPADLGLEYSGLVYAIGQVDTRDDVMEPLEDNNVIAELISVASPVPGKKGYCLP